MSRAFHPRSCAVLAIASLPVALGLAGCGGGGGSTTATAPAPSSSTTTTAAPPKQATQHRPDAAGQRSPTNSPPPPPGPPAVAFQPKSHNDSGGGSAQFIVKGADNSVQEFGSEGQQSELETAATALHGFVDARAERNWAAACNYLSKAAKQGFAPSSASSQPPSCAATLAALSGKVPTATLREAAVADVGSLRREGESGFLIYRGAPSGTVYAISIAKQGGAWKIASLAGTPLN
jgi:hypothetical protein